MRPTGNYAKQVRRYCRLNKITPTHLGHRLGLGMLTTYLAGDLVPESIPFYEDTLRKEGIIQ